VTDRPRKGDHVSGCMHHRDRPDGRRRACADCECKRGGTAGDDRRPCASQYIDGGVRGAVMTVRKPCTMVAITTGNDRPHENLRQHEWVVWSGGVWEGSRSLAMRL